MWWHPCDVGSLRICRIVTMTARPGNEKGPFVQTSRRAVYQTAWLRVGRGTCHPGEITPGMQGEIILEWWGNYLGMGGRRHSGIMGGFARNRHERNTLICRCN